MRFPRLLSGGGRNTLLSHLGEGGKWDVQGILEDVSADKWLANSASGNESGNERPLSLPLSLAVVKDR